MANRKPNKKYYFSVEGETEQWYLKWLQEIINDTEEAAYKVSIDCPVRKNPLKHAKSLDAMDNMKKAQNLGKQIIYKSGYSNFTFDLWLILHMTNCNGAYTHRKQYITAINRAYNENFQDMDEFKKEDNFKRCLKKLQLSNVIDAVNRAKTIMQKNKDNGYALHQYKGYKYYKENPSLTAWEAIEKILLDCKLI